jgi:hypothetical protein
VGEAMVCLPIWHWYMLRGDWLKSGSGMVWNNFINYMRQIKNMKGTKTERYCKDFREEDKTIAFLGEMNKKTTSQVQLFGTSLTMLEKNSKILNL